MRVFQSEDDRLVQLRKTSGSKIDSTEKMIQRLIENNLSTIFPNLEFLKTEYKIGNFKMDSVAFDTSRNSFVIIEYKNIRHGGILDQISAYGDLLREHKAEFILMYQRIKNKMLDESLINLDEARDVMGN